MKTLLHKFYQSFLSLFLSFTIYGQTTDNYTSGTTSWTVPAGVTSITVECWGGGGGGGAARIQTGGADVIGVGGGGKGGMYASKTVNVVPGQNVIITVGAGGAAGNNSLGGSGGNSSVTINSTIEVRASGGSGGFWAGNGGTGGNGDPMTNYENGNATGLGIGTIIHHSGNGGGGYRYTTGNYNTNQRGYAGGGGGAGGATNNATDGERQSATITNKGSAYSGGTGGTTPSGNGGNGGNGGFAASGTSATSNGSGGITPGGGGGGGAIKRATGSGSATGGAGARGEVRITYTSIPCSVAPDLPTVIAGNASPCSGSSQTYSVTNDPNATSYTWTLPSGFTGTSTTNSITVNASSNAGSLTVIANNGCGSSSAQTLSITPTTVPAQPSAISGTQSLCSGSVENYSVTNDPSATSYSWTLPGTWSGSSSTNAISATVGTSNGTITVRAVNACGNSTQQTLSVTNLSSPAQPSAINGITAVCANATETYSVTNDATATSYTWTLPSGYSGTSTTNTIDATAGSTGGTITVTANNACGSSITQTVNTTINTAPAQPSVIAGTTAVCANATETYSVTNDATATSYTWTLPSGYSGTSTTNTIDAIAGSTGGTITVTANNACGSSIAQTVNTTINTAPAQPSVINGNTAVCANATETYSVTNDATATSYTWTLPSGYTGTSTTNSIVATAGSTGGIITVTANNTCGSSTPRTVSLTINTVNTTVAISGITLTSNQAGATYRWLDCNNGNSAIPSAISQSFTPTANGSYAVEVTINGCTQTSTCSTISTVGIEENTLGQTIKVYPNPTKGNIQIKFENDTENFTLRLLSVSGQVIGTKNSSGNTLVDWNIEQPSGVYFIEISNKIGEKAIFKLIKE